MGLFDLPLTELRRYRPEVREPADFDRFWADTLAAARRHAPLVAVEPVKTQLTLLETADVTFAGFDGHPVRAWYTRPADRAGQALPVVVEYLGYGRGRGLPHERLVWSCAGYAHLLMDTRGQGAQYGNGGHTPDPVGSPPAAPGFLTRGVEDPEQAYLRRLFTDAARAVDAAAALPDVDAGRIAVVGNSQGGGLAIAAAGLNDAVRVLLSSAALFCHYERSVAITDTHPYAEVVQYLSVHREAEERVLAGLSYFDGVNLARRARASAHFGAGLRDRTCPPSGIFAAFNHLPNPDKDIEVYPYNGHEGGEALHTARQLSFLRARLG
ncbi:acetylxylan esterase [Saccharothrix syringae]|uniref:Acetylxylan esterase n=1 Tax=Saccharothrix syringae TaxID=103733 RepID=A0A5Q0GVZ0_SACSY|nr:acetylxylan esterase [Saccharothrix syringae]QFZ18286.1 acetylxylan esterase [Saccharothrix syringae]